MKKQQQKGYQKLLPIEMFYFFAHTHTHTQKKSIIVTYLNSFALTKLNYQIEITALT